ncbi:MAG: hypothetical protein Q9162_005321 [Coniocarpon cinnabarinum]
MALSQNPKKSNASAFKANAALPTLEERIIQSSATAKRRSVAATDATTSSFNSAHPLPQTEEFGPSKQAGKRQIRRPARFAGDLYVDPITSAIEHGSIDGESQSAAKPRPKSKPKQKRIQEQPRDQETFRSTSQPSLPVTQQAKQASPDVWRGWSKQPKSPCRLHERYARSGQSTASIRTDPDVTPPISSFSVPYLEPFQEPAYSDLVESEGVPQSLNSLEATEREIRVLHGSELADPRWPPTTQFRQSERPEACEISRSVSPNLFRPITPSKTVPESSQILGDLAQLQTPRATSVDLPRAFSSDQSLVLGSENILSLAPQPHRQPLKAHRIGSAGGRTRSPTSRLLERGAASADRPLQTTKRGCLGIPGNVIAGRDKRAQGVFHFQQNSDDVVFEQTDRSLNAQFFVDEEKDPPAAVRFIERYPCSQVSSDPF